MRKHPFHWPSDRSLFREKGRRRSAAVWIVVAGSVAAALVVAAVWRHPLP